MSEVHRGWKIKPEGPGDSFGPSQFTRKFHLPHFNRPKMMRPWNSCGMSLLVWSFAHMFFLSLFPYCLTAACPSNPHIWGDVSVTIYLYYLLWSLSLQKTLITKATSSLSCSENQEFSQYLPFQVMYNIPKHSTNLSSTVNFAFLLNFLSLPARASSSAWGPCHLRMTRWARTMPRTVLILQIPDS